MKTAVIDVGSNSVRLMLWQDGKTLYKALNTTRLGENTAITGKICAPAMERTANAVKEFYDRALSEGAEEVYCFATEAVRSAKNGGDFCAAVKARCGLNVDVLSGGLEAETGALGALSGEDGMVIDVGGASSEVVLSLNKKTAFAHSFNLGAVRLYDLCGRDFNKLSRAIDNKISEVQLPRAEGLKVCAIGGTATSLAAVSLALKEYDPNLVHGAILAAQSVENYAKMFCSMTVEEVKKIVGMDVRRADVIGGGALMLARLAKALGAENITVSESDNLEGYLLYRQSI